MPAPQTLAGNRLLEALPEVVQARLAPLLDEMALGRGAVIFRPHARQGHVYFPTDCVISLVHTLADGHTAEVGQVGCEGVVGLALVLGGETSPDEAVVQVAGSAFRMTATAMQAEFRRGGPFQYALLRYTQARMSMISQTAVCNRLHQVEPRLCRWLLMTHDQVAGEDICVTHDLMSHLLGVRREGVTAAASHLQACGLIRCTRGHVRILDAARLEVAACECYGVVKDKFARLLGA